MSKQRFKKLANLKNISAFLIVLVITILGVHLILSSHAESPYGTSFADAGTVAAPATIQADSGATDGKYLQFGAPAPAPITFSVVGNKIMESNGSQFVPYGIVLECPGIKNTNSIPAVCSQNNVTGNTGTDEITAAAQDWNANDIRLQVSQENLFSGPGGAVNPAYVSIVDGLVNQANSLGMVATITLQEEDANGPAFPTDDNNYHATAFWQYMADHYKSNPHVFFDLYNEPKLPPAAFGSEGTWQQVWNVWQNGGNALWVDSNDDIGTTQTSYVGMQSLINTIRAEGASNIIIAEGPDYDHDLTEVCTHYLTGGDIAYGTEPNPSNATDNDDTTCGTLGSSGNDRTQAQQFIRFGQFAATVPIVPEAFLDNWGTHNCDATSPEDVPEMLAYLKSLNMGVLFWTLEPGRGIIGTNLANPTTYPGGVTNIGSSDCPFIGGSDPTNITSNSIGDGADLQAYMKANSVQFHF